MVITLHTGAIGNVIKRNYRQWRGSSKELTFYNCKLYTHQLIYLFLGVLTQGIINWLLIQLQVVVCIIQITRTRCCESVFSYLLKTCRMPIFIICLRFHWCRLSLRLQMPCGECYAFSAKKGQRDDARCCFLLYEQVFAGDCKFFVKVICRTVNFSFFSLMKKREFLPKRCYSFHCKKNSMTQF